MSVRCAICGCDAPDSVSVDVGLWICTDHDANELADLAEELMEADLEERDA